MSVRHPNPLVRACSVPFMVAIRVYQVTLSPILGGQCRFHPTCSNYALDAYREYGPIRGSRLTAVRLLRCHPFSRGGYDPVPPPPCSSAGAAGRSEGGSSSARYPVD